MLNITCLRQHYIGEGEVGIVHFEIGSYNTLQLQRLPSSELTKLAMRQSEFVSLELERHRSFWLSNSALASCDGSQLGYFHYFTTCGGRDKKCTFRISLPDHPTFSSHLG